MGEESGRGSGRVGSEFLSAIAGRVGSTFRRVGSGPRKVTRGQLWEKLVINILTTATDLSTSGRYALYRRRNVVPGLKASGWNLTRHKFFNI